MKTKAAILLAPLLVACSSADPRQRIDPIGPDRAQFDDVAPVLVYRCGTLDCHGSTYRNLRLYGWGGSRLDPQMLPDREAHITTKAEIDADYDAVIALEPTVMKDVLRDKGAQPERLTFVRKARNAEAHKGNDAVKTGDDADRCIVTWLAGATDADACHRVLPWNAQ